jgi:hypothetical protein
VARFTLEEFSDRRPELVYIVGNVVDAEQVEAVFNEMAIDYALNIEAYANNSFFGGTYQGVFFYVSDKDAENCRECLHAKGFPDTVSRDEQELTEQE